MTPGNSRINALRHWGIVSMFLLAACGAAPAGEGGVRDASVVADVVIDRDAVVGTFQVQLVPPSDAGAGYTAVVGRVQDGPTPAQILWDRAATGGDCELQVPRVPFCGTPCGGAVCVADDTCRGYPSPRSVGAITITGLRSSAGDTVITLTEVASTYQLGGGVTLPFPAFGEGGAIGLAAAGSAFAPAFAINALGIAPLALTGSTPRVVSGSPLELTWVAPAQMGARIRVHLDISHHGGTRGQIECDTADDGSLTIPADLVTRLVSFGVAGFPSVRVTRVNAGSASIPAGRVELSVMSAVEAPVDLPNLRSCTSDTDCTTGTCRADLTCR